VAWPDVAFFAALGLAGFALVAQSAFEEEITEAETVEFALPSATVTVTALEELAKDDKAVLLVVKRIQASKDVPISYESVRYVAVSSGEVKEGPQTTPVRVLIERGEKDAGATKFSADLAAAKVIYLLSG
jgi:hypothetical protein